MLSYLAQTVFVFKQKAAYEVPISDWSSDVCSSDLDMGDAAEAFTMLEGGAPIRVLAVFNNGRLPGKLNSVPAAKEQGYDIDWPIIRGFYVGPKVSDQDYQFWVDALDRKSTRLNSSH